MSTLPVGTLALLHCDGTNGSTTFTNAVIGGLTYTAAAAAALTTTGANVKFGSAAGDFTAVGRLDPSAPVNFTGDFWITWQGSRNQYTGKIFCIGNETAAGAMNLEHFVNNANLITTNAGGTAIGSTSAPFGQPGDGYRQGLVMRVSGVLYFAVEDSGGQLQLVGSVADTSTYSGNLVWGDKYVSGGTPEGSNCNFWLDELAFGTGTPYSTSFPQAAETAAFTLPVGALPVITQQPTSQSVSPASTAAFSVVAQDVVSYQWQDDRTGAFVNVSDGSGGTTASYTTTATTQSHQGRRYRVLVTNANGTVTSAVAQLAVPGFPAYLWPTNVQVGNDVWLRDPIQQGAASGAVLAATPQAVSSVTADLSTAISLAGNSQAQATTTAGLTTAITLNAAASAVGSATAAISTAIQLAAVPAASASIAAGLSTAIQLAASSAAVATASGTLNTGAAALEAAPQAAASVTAALTTGIALAAAPAAVATASGTLTSGSAVLASSAAAVATATGALSTGIVLASAPAAVAAASGALSTSIALASSPASAATATGALSTSIVLAAAPAAVATTTASLTTTPQGFSATATAQATATAALTTSIVLAGAPAAVAAITADLSTSIRLASAPQSVTAASGALTTAIQLSSAAAGVAQATASISTAIQLAAAAQGVASASGTLDGSATNVAAAATASATLTAALSTAIAMAASASSVASASASLTTSGSDTGGGGGSASPMLRQARANVEQHRKKRQPETSPFLLPPIVPKPAEVVPEPVAEPVDRTQEAVAQALEQLLAKAKAPKPPAPDLPATPLETLVSFAEVRAQAEADRQAGIDAAAAKLARTNRNRAAILLSMLMMVDD